MKNWQAKKSNNGKRVDMYAHPGVMEVIYKNEWNKKNTGGLSEKIKSFFGI